MSRLLGFLSRHFFQGMSNEIGLSSCCSVADVLANRFFLFTKSLTACITSQHVVTLCDAKKLILVFPDSLKSTYFRILLSFWLISESIVI